MRIFGNRGSLLCFGYYGGEVVCITWNKIKHQDKEFTTYKLWIDSPTASSSPLSMTVAAVLSLVPSIIGQSVFLAGDSTMAPGGDGAGTGTDGMLLSLLISTLPPWSASNQGWGQFLAQYLTIPVVNNAVAGTSARSFTTLGLFATLIDEVSSGDFVGKYSSLPNAL